MGRKLLITERWGEKVLFVYFNTVNRTTT